MICASAAALTPLDRLLVETDAPFLTPVPHRGTPNRPALVALVGEAIADLRGISHSEMATRTLGTVAPCIASDGAPVAVS